MNIIANMNIKSGLEKVLGKDLKVFLDVDISDFKIDDLEGYIDRTDTILVFCSEGYFTSKNCMRELVASVVKGKEIVALVDPEPNHGGLSQDEVESQLAKVKLSDTR